MKAELRDLTPKPPREVVVTMSEEEARCLGYALSFIETKPAGRIEAFGQLLRRVVEG